jgi:hypothetical protein
MLNLFTLKKGYMRLVLFLCFLLAVGGLQAQRKGTLVIVSDSPCSLWVNGEEEGRLAADESLRLSLREGEHMIVARHAETQEERRERVVVSAAEQGLLTLQFRRAAVAIADLTLTIPKALQRQAGGPNLYYSLAANDQLVVNISPLSSGGSQSVQLLSYPQGSVLYSADGLTTVTDQRIRIPQTGIYRLVLSTTYNQDRRIRLQLSRIPADASTQGHDTRVFKRVQYEAVSVESPGLHWLNSLSNAYIRGGSDRILLPVSLPENTVEWFYTVSASRDRESISQNLRTISLVRDVAKAIMSGSVAATALNFSFQLITQPPGSDYCDVYLLQEQGRKSFAAGEEVFAFVQEGSRENVSSAKVRIKGSGQRQFYLALRNRDTFNGLAVGIEIVALVAKESWATTP